MSADRQPVLAEEQIAELQGRFGAMLQAPRLGPDYVSTIRVRDAIALLAIAASVGEMREILTELRYRLPLTSGQAKRIDAALERKAE